MRKAEAITSDTDSTTRMARAHRHLLTLYAEVDVFLGRLWSELKHPPGQEVVQRIAVLAERLSQANARACHDGLGMAGAEDLSEGGPWSTTALARLVGEGRVSALYVCPCCQWQAVVVSAVPIAEASRVTIRWMRHVQEHFVRMHPEQADFEVVRYLSPP